MSKVIVTKTKLDNLANAISNKSGEPVTMTLDEMVSAVDGIETGGGGITPTGNIDITQAGVTDVSEYATATVPSALYDSGFTSEYTTESGSRKWTPYAYVDVDETGWVGSNISIYGAKYNAIPTGTSVTPTESAQTIGGANTMLEGAVTVNAIPSNYVGSGVRRRDYDDLVVSGASVTVPGGYYEDGATKTIASGTEGTPTATKGTVSNHAVSVTPSVTNSAGYISGGTHSGTAVSVSASELVSGNLPITQNGNNIDVTNYATVSVDVQGGGSTPMTVATATKTLSAAASSIQFTNLSGEPTSFAVTSSTNQSTGGTKVVAVVYDGTSCHGMDLTTQAEADTGFTQSYSNGTLTITATTASFQANEYKLVYTYGGTAGNVQTEDVQVGSGATSITFTGLSDEPDYFSCIFKSTFSTSSGYQRVMEVVYDGTSTYGHALDSSAKALTSWSYSYSSGSLTITSTGTNNGGYFHQPGYYQLTYAIGGDQTLQTKTVTPTTSTQNVTADTAQGYTALKKVVVEPIPSSYVQPTSTVGATTYRASTSSQTIQSGTYHSAAATIAAVTQTNLEAANIKQGTTITISNGQSNLWSVTGTYSGGGGGTLTVATKTITQASTTQTLTFTSLSGQPKYWFLRATSNVSSSGSTTYYYVTDCFYDGTNIKGNTFRIGSTRRVQNITSGISQSYSSGTLTITAGSSSGATPGQFYGASSFGYELVYIY